MHGKGVHVWGGHAWLGAWQGTCMVQGVHGGGHAWHGGGGMWHEEQPLQRAVRILLECILVIKY